jgi:uncharacterized integral membrane protein (TIGR00697 family)
MIRKFDLIIALYIFGVLTAEIMGAKTFPILNTSFLHLNASVAIFVMPLLFTITDVVVEVHGKKRARSMVICGLICASLLILYATLATHLPPSQRFALTEPAYDKIFGSSVRIAAASLVAFAASELLDVFIFAKLREKMHKRALWFRNNLSNFISQFVDSAIFLTVAFYSFQHSFSGNFTFLIGLLIPYWAIRCVLSVVETPLVYLGVRWLRKPESPSEELKPTKA